MRQRAIEDGERAWLAVLEQSHVAGFQIGRELASLPDVEGEQDQPGLCGKGDGGGSPAVLAVRPLTGARGIDRGSPYNATVEILCSICG